MAEAFLNGRAASFGQAVGEAARLLAGAAPPLVGGRARTRRRSHEFATPLLARRSRSWRTARHGCSRRRKKCALRADVLLLIGAGPSEARPELPDRAVLAAAASRDRRESPRRIIWLVRRRPGQADGSRRREGGGRNRRDVLVLRAALRAACRRRPVGTDRAGGESARRARRDLRRARFGVRSGPAALDEPAIDDAAGAGRTTSTRTPASPSGAGVPGNGSARC